MTVIGLDVVVVSNTPDNFAAEWQGASTEFYIRFGLSSAIDAAALASFGLQLNGSHEQSSTSFGEPVMDSATTGTLNPDWVHFTVNSVPCPNIAAFIGPNELVYFLHDSGRTYSLIPTSNVLREFNLRKGCNHVICEHNPSQSSIQFDIWLYDLSDRLIVMDIDGTITKSDVRGYLTTVMLGQYDYIHEGLVPFLNITTSSFMDLNILYLTARPITHTRETRLFLQHAKEGDITLPRGPLFPFKHGSMKALFQELIAKTTVAFKSGVLISILDAYKTVGGPTFSESPFFLGFGNKETDAQAYTLAGLTPERILIVDKSSQLTVWSNRPSAATPQRSNSRDGKAGSVEKSGDFPTSKDSKVVPKSSFWESKSCDEIKGAKDGITDLGLAKSSSGSARATGSGSGGGSNGTETGSLNFKSAATSNSLAGAAGGVDRAALSAAAGGGAAGRAVMAPSGPSKRGSAVAAAATAASGRDTGSTRTHVTFRFHSYADQALLLYVEGLRGHGFHLSDDTD